MILIIRQSGTSGLPIFGLASRRSSLIAGPTASGKSSRAVALAKSLMNAGQDAAIVNADSAQVYADLHILSARPDADEMGGVSHRLFGTWDGAVPCSAADWARAAKAVIAELHQRRTVPILVGGTGLYLRVLLDGIAPVPAIDPEIRAAVRAMPLADARHALERADPDAARRIAPADTTRTQRALEVAQSTGGPLPSGSSTRPAASQTRSRFRRRSSCRIANGCKRGATCGSRRCWRLVRRPKWQRCWRAISTPTCR